MTEVEFLKELKDHYSLLESELIFLENRSFDPLFESRYRVCESFHPQRKKEFLGGRLAAHRVCQKLKKDIQCIDSHENRAPIWPAGMVGSISHSSQYAMAIGALSENYWALGVDIEDRHRSTERLVKKILTPYEELNFLKNSTLIFSAKEAVYKALYPLVNKFFGLMAVEFIELDHDQQKFKIRICEQLSLDVGPQCKINELNGRFYFFNETLCTIVSLNHL